MVVVHRQIVRVQAYVMNKDCLRQNWKHEIYIRKPIPDIKSRLKSLNGLFNTFVSFCISWSLAICTVHVLKNKAIVSAALNKSKTFLRTVLLSEIFVLEYLWIKVVNIVYFCSFSFFLLQELSRIDSDS